MYDASSNPALSRNTCKCEETATVESTKCNVSYIYLYIYISPLFLLLGFLS